VFEYDDMNTVDHFTRLFAYGAWANQRCRLRTAAQPLVRKSSHILASERLWLERLEQKEQTLPVWPSLQWKSVALAADQSRLWKHYLRQAVADLAPVSYRNSKAKPEEPQG
jgi:uncharacterized damage-inducible protein DinB